MRKSIYLLFAATFLLFSSSSFSQVTMVMKALDNNGVLINGGSTVAGHLKEIDMLAWSHGMSSPCAIGGTCNPYIQDLSFTTYLNAATIKLKQMLLQGLQLQSVDLTFIKNGAAPFVFMRMRLEGVIVSSVSEGGSGGESQFTANVSFLSTRIAWQFITQNTDGTAGGRTNTGWDLALKAPWTYY